MPELLKNQQRHLAGIKLWFYKVPQESVKFDDISTLMSIEGMKIALNTS